MIEVFKTNVKGLRESKRIGRQLEEQMPGSDIHFDLEDCDKVLRINHREICQAQVILTLSRAGYQCEVMV